MNFEGKKVVYVGAFGGIGFAMCKALIAKNIQELVVLDKSLDQEKFTQLQNITPNIAVHFYEYDVTASSLKMAEIFKQIVAKIAAIDVLINGAGICNDKFVELTIQVNLIGLINTTTAAFEYMDKRKTNNKGGMIVNIASVVGLDPAPQLCVYSASKAAVISFTRSIAEWHSQTGIVLMAVCPGFTTTPLLDDMGLFMSPGKMSREVIESRPQQTAEQCAENFICAMETNKNGSIWLLEEGKITEVEMKKYWDAPPAFS